MWPVAWRGGPLVWLGPTVWSGGLSRCPSARRSASVVSRCSGAERWGSARCAEAGVGGVEDQRWPRRGARPRRQAEAPALRRPCREGRAERAAPRRPRPAMPKGPAGRAMPPAPVEPRERRTKTDNAGSRAVGAPPKETAPWSAPPKEIVPWRAKGNRAVEGRAKGRQRRGGRAKGPVSAVTATRRQHRDAAPVDRRPSGGRQGHPRPNGRHARTPRGPHAGAAAPRPHRRRPAWPHPSWPAHPCPHRDADRRLGWAGRVTVSAVAAVPPVTTSPVIADDVAGHKGDRAAAAGRSAA